MSENKPISRWAMDDINSLAAYMTRKSKGAWVRNKDFEEFRMMKK